MGDPLFRDVGTGDYHLSASSPCIDAGDGTAPGLPAEDFEGEMEDFGREIERISDKYEVGSERWKREVRKALKDLKERN